MAGRATTPATTTVLRLWILSGTTRVSQYQIGKTNLDLLEQEIVSGSGISWAICKSAPHPGEITMPASHHSVFTGQMLFLLPNQQRQSTEGRAFGVITVGMMEVGAPIVQMGWHPAELSVHLPLIFPYTIKTQKMLSPRGRSTCLC